MTGSPDALPQAVTAMIAATNAEDTAAFLAAFAPDAVVDDFGRTFAGRAAIRRWSDAENIGTHNRIRVTGAASTDPSADTVDVRVRVAGNGYNGDGRFTITLVRGLIGTLTIRE